LKIVNRANEAKIKEVIAPVKICCSVKLPFMQEYLSYYNFIKYSGLNQPEMYMRREKLRIVRHISEVSDFATNISISLTETK